MVSLYLRPKGRYPSQLVLRSFSSAKQLLQVRAEATEVKATENFMQMIEYIWIEIIVITQLDDRMIEK